MEKHGYMFHEGPGKADFVFEDSDVRRIVVKAYANGTVRLKIYEKDLLIQAVMSNQAAVDLGDQIAAIARDNE